MPIVLSVSPNDEILGAKALDQTLAVCSLPIWERWAAGDRFSCISPRLRTRKIPLQSRESSANWPKTSP